jgi:chromosomal replication initiator protein
MTKMKASIWREAAKSLEEVVPREEYNRTFAGIHLVSFQDGTAVLGVRNDDHRCLLEEKYLPTIEQRLGHLSGQPIEVRFEVVPGKKHPQPSGNGGSSARNRQRPRRAEPTQESFLNPRYTFDNFVVGGSNRMTHAAALAVASAPAKTYNPLFIYGGVGLGKTHVMHAIGNAVINNGLSSRVVYIPAEQFVNEFINSIKKNDRQEFQARFRNVDVLLIDDIHFLAGKESTQEEFFHTFNALHNSHKQIIISSDRSPKEIPTIEERLRSRFEWGLITDIQPPDLETRVAILRRKCEEESVNLPDDVTLFIANKVRNSVRELEGALVKVAAYSSLNNEVVSIDMAARVLRDFLSREDREISIERIIRGVAEHFRLKPQDLLGSSRSRSVALPRQIAMYLSRELTNHSFPEIGSFFGKKDHSTVMHAYKKIASESENNEEFHRMLERLVQVMKSQMN